MPKTLTPEQFTAQVNNDWNERKLNAPNATPEADMLFALNQNPLGELSGEANLQTPFNTPKRRPNVFVVNHSRTKERRVCVVPVSSLQGAEEAMMYKGPKGENLRKAYGNAENLYKAAEKGRDLSIYEDVIEPANFIIPFNGRRYVVAPAPANDPNNPPVEEVDEGIWDLYCGNYERMNATKDNGRGQIVSDDTTRSEEVQRLALRWARKKNPVWRTVEDGRPQTRENAFGFVEFIREIPKEAPQRLDGAMVTASEMAEVE
jgi:hypothetical protein